MHHIIIQHAADKSLAPKASLLRKWAITTLKGSIDSAELTIRLVGIEEMAELNSTYRHKTGPTNVLSFPFTMPDHIPIDIPILGDIVLCTELVNRQAKEQGKSQDAHWAHLVVHGTFHLLGYDHETADDAKMMESLEIETLKTLGFANPYETGDEIKNHG